MNAHLLWPSPPTRPTLESNGAHVWSASLDLAVAQTRAFAELCAPDERARAAQFHFEHDRQRFLVRRGLLRTLLSAYGAGPAADLQFTVGPYGKPALIPRRGAMPVQFNASHSHRVFLCAVTRGAVVGVDVEQVRALSDAENIARRFFSSAEYASWSNLPRRQQLEAFFACWTRKEAFVKATGAGLNHRLGSFDVSLRPDEPPRLVCVADDPPAARRFSLYHLAPSPGYIGALAVECSGCEVECWQWG